MKRILIGVDVQNDFMPGGALPVPGGDEIVPIINSIWGKFDKVIWTKDWHPVKHCSFKPRGPWPPHCVQNTEGASLHKGLTIMSNDNIITKGMDPTVDSYSGFYDNERKKATGLNDLLHVLSRDRPQLWICGLALEYCVKFTVIDALKEGYETYVIADACRGINPGDIQKAMDEMVAGGAIITNSKVTDLWVKEKK